MQPTVQPTVKSSRHFWLGVLGPGGTTAIPRWTLDAVPGVAKHHVAVDADLIDAVRRLSTEVGVPLSSVLLAAHAKVLALLSGDLEVVTGYVAGRTATLPCRLSTQPDTWRAMLLHVRAIEVAMASNAGFPVADLSRELGLGGPLFETVLDTTGTDGELGENAVLKVGMAPDGTRLSLHYRSDVLDVGAAARVAGYYLATLRLMTTNPDAVHQGQNLLSHEELRHQLVGLKGPHRELPDQRFHELFEEQVRRHPTAVAAVHGDRSRTYSELNAQANRIARALLARGLGREGVVGVVMERNLDWMASVLAIFKAGGVYLPLEPHFPSDRIAAVLTRADCRLVLTESASTTTLDGALASLPDIRRLLVTDALDEDGSGGDLDVPVSSDQLAYIYFTSGSTGEPKGAMCEHAGMLNHLFAKIDDLGISEGQVVAQTAPQCFDISLWQLVSGLMVGGQTLLVEQEAVLDIQLFVDRIVERRVSVLQVVPSYLEAVLSYLEQHPRELPDLRCVSVTGEAVKKELVQRWFRARPEVRLVNAYGLTETSDDTNHEVMDRVPDQERIPVGRPVNNVHVYIVDEHLSPVPLGAIGEIVFSGICVGRGYINDPDRTRAAFTVDPHRPGSRLYRSGDFGRWLPDGKVEFLGRRDTQVKVSGFRIEIGEIENALLRVPGVRDGAVVVAERPDRSRHLVAYYTGGEPIATTVLRERLARSLPEYMVPTVFHPRDGLPLTANGKVDRKTLTRLAGELDSSEDNYLAPTTPAEQRIAAAWAKVLGVPVEQIGRKDHFFDRGGTSLSAVKLAIALDREVSLKDVTRYPVLAELAAVVNGRSGRRSELLHPLVDAGDPVGVLVCFPYAGGNAVNFQPMAMPLRASGLALYAVELPGHDVAAEREPFASVPETAERVVDEIVRRGLDKIMLWGHSSGTACAVETARRLEERGLEVQRLFLCAQLPGGVTDRLEALAALDELSNRDITAELSSDGGYTELRELDAQLTAMVGAAYRQDCASAHRYFVDLIENPPAVKLSAPVTVVIAADDPSTAGSYARYADWKLVAEHVELHALDDGGHYFLRTRPAEAAQIVVRAAEMFATSGDC